MMKPSDEDIAFWMERLSWYDFVSEDQIEAFDAWGWAVVDHGGLVCGSTAS
jgi:hypothetical protein